MPLTYVCYHVRLATYDFPLVMNNSGLSHTVSKINGDFSRKSQKVLGSLFIATAEGVSIGIL